jgi:hypothetical protein
MVDRIRVPCAYSGKVGVAVAIAALVQSEWENVHAPPLPVKSKTIARRQWSRTAKHLGCDGVA